MSLYNCPGVVFVKNNFSSLDSFSFIVLKDAGDADTSREYCCVNLIQ